MCSWKVESGVLVFSWLSQLDGNSDFKAPRCGTQGLADESLFSQAARARLNVYASVFDSVLLAVSSCLTRVSVF